MHFKYVDVIIHCPVLHCCFCFVFKVGNVVLWTELNAAQHKRLGVEQSLQTVTNWHCLGY